MKEPEVQFRQAKAVVKSELERLGDLRETHPKNVEFEQRIDPVTKSSKAASRKRL